jgi:hypothetical protein
VASARRAEDGTTRNLDACLFMRRHLLNVKRRLQEIENAKNNKVYTESLGYFVDDDDDPS